MRIKLLLALVTAAALVSAGTGYVAVAGISVDPGTSTLTGQWISVDHGTTIRLGRGGTFTATGIDHCLGKVRAVLEDGDRAEVVVDGAAVLDVTSGAGTWTTKGLFLFMTFRSPRHFTIRWQASPVTWRFRPTEVTLTSANGTRGDDGEAFPVTCAFTGEPLNGTYR